LVREYYALWPGLTASNSKGDKIMANGGCKLALGTVLVLAMAAGPVGAESIALVCETTSDLPECDARLVVPPCLAGPRSVVLNVDFALGRVEFSDTRMSVVWIATGAKVSETVMEWDKFAPWPKNPALESRFSGTLNRLTGDVAFDFRYDQGPGRTWSPRGFAGKCRRATQKF